MTSALLILLVVAAAMAAPLQWLELEKSTAVTKQHTTLGDIYSFCNKSGSNNYFVISSITITPDPPKRGKLVNITVDYTLKEEVTGGQVIVVAKYNGMTLYDATLRLCDAVYAANLSCPVKPVAHGRAVITVTVPDLFFPGHYTGSARVTDQNGAEVGCIDVDFHLK